MADENRRNKNLKDGPNPEYENFQRFLDDAPSVSREELDNRREEYEREGKKRAG